MAGIVGEMITSSQNPRIKLVRALLEHPKERRKAGAYVAEGVRLIEDAHKAGWPIRFVLHTNELNERGRSLLVNLDLKKTMIEQVSENLMHAISDTDTPQGILAVLDSFSLAIPDSLDFVLIPDQVRDPGNLGAMIRTAEAAGVQAVLIPPETTDAFAPKVVRAGMGAHFRLPIQPMEWRDIFHLSEHAEIKTSSGQWNRRRLTAILADMKGIPCWEADFQQPLVLIVGGEAEGASRQARQAAQVTVSIPMVGGTESLNAAVAGAILMFEVARQRR